MILVTGGTGLVGSQLLYDLVGSGEKIRALRRKGSSMHVVERLFSEKKDDFKNIEWFDGDVNDLFSLEDAMDGVGKIYHSAAFVSFYQTDRRKIMKVNVEGTANMVNMALKKGVKRFCHVSSVASLSRSGDKFIDEDSWWVTSKKNSNYAISKYGGEREVWRGMEEGLSAFVINPTIIIGPGDWKSGSTQMFSQVWKGLSFYADGIAGFVDVRDVSKAALTLMEKGVSNQRFIVNSENVTYRYVFDLIAEGMNKKKARYRVSPLLGEIGWRFEAMRSMFMRNKPMITKETARNGQMQWHYSNEKIKTVTGMNFISVEQSVKDTCRCYMKELKIEN